MNEAIIKMTDDGDFEDLFAGGDVAQDLSKDSLIATAADLTCNEGRYLDMLLNRSERDSTTAARDAREHCIETRDDSRSATSAQDESTAEQPSTTPGPSTFGVPTSVIDHIEHVFKNIAKALLNDKELSVTLKHRATIGDGSILQKTAAERWAEAKPRRICFPGKTADEAWRFSASSFFAQYDIYYRDPALFGSQSHVDRYVDDIAFTFGIPRSALNITAVAKGLVAGAFSLCRRDGSIVDARADREGTLVPNLRDVLSVDMKAAEWILVIEKEASFRSVASSPFWDRVQSQGVIITGKGYPDIATRALLRYMSIPSPQNGFASPLVHALVDFDPDGLAILSVYKHGSNALAHENADLIVPKTKHLGLRSTHVSVGIENEAASQALLTLTARDRRKATKMLERERGEDARLELQRMLMLGVKAELQLLDAVPGGMLQMLEAEL
ncbi:Meiotic recombination protein SPO11 [Teratosphaeria destructans]|uniref:DNA topoisomerase (ATP-hydrolyzing) n=1 Tax=Teratosphaeria destructans TaxID=418781 RepID=A0A9W7SUM2_9PEZI|nr:Meiotic recombination protein SPO11 [Teratosphaeria destructans]